MGRNTKIKDIKIIRTGIGEIKNESEHFERVGTEGCIPINRDDIEWYADEPCVEACQKLYDLNIRTYTSGGHVNGEENTTGSAFIGIDYDSLSDENKNIVQKLIEDRIVNCINAPDGRNNFYSFNIETTIDSDSLVGDVSDRLLDHANNFKIQDVLYGRATLQELKNRTFPKQENETYKDKFLLEDNLSKEEVEKRFNEYLESGLFGYTDNGEDFFISEDLLRKHNEYVESLNMQNQANK